MSIQLSLQSPFLLIVDVQEAEYLVYFMNARNNLKTHLYHHKLESKK